MRRRDFLAAGIVFPFVSPKYRLQFPRDHGAHPEFRTEWWYVTGWVRDAKQQDLGFQITFFRARLPFEDANPSRQIGRAHV